MTQVTVKELADVVATPVERLLQRRIVLISSPACINEVRDVVGPLV